MLKQDYKFDSRALYPELKGKRVIVTGGASGIGKATAKRFVLEGAKVGVFDYNDKAFDALKEEIPGLAGAVKVDVSSEESVKAAFTQMDQILGGIDVLISNAGISIRKKFIETDFAQWKRVMGVNLDGMCLCIMNRKILEVLETLHFQDPAFYLFRFTRRRSRVRVSQSPPRKIP